MPIVYTNRKGYQYYLCQGMTKTGKVRYYFSRDPKEEMLDQIPLGYRVNESVNGIVSLAKDLPPLILPQEVASIEATLKHHPKGRDYRVGVQKNRIVIYERLGPDAELLSEIFAPFNPLPADMLKKKVQESLDKVAKFNPVMRFTLIEPEGRIFEAERWCYFGNVDDWIPVGESGKLDKLVRKLIPKLGTDAFFELM